MRKYILSLTLGGLMLCSAAIAVEPGEVEEAERQLALRKMELQMAKMEADVKHDAEMRKLEIEKRRLEMDRARKQLDQALRHKCEVRGLFQVWLLGCAVVHILSAIWVYTDIRRRNTGSGIWVVITVLAGLLGALVYAVIRLGDGSPTTRSRR